MASTATIRVQFGSGSTTGLGVNYFLSAEVDDRDPPDGLNPNGTSFAPGDPAVILIYKSANVKIDSITPSTGGCPIGPEVDVTKTVELMFEDTDTASMPFPATGISNVAWIGTPLGNLTLSADGTSVKASSKGVAVCQVDVATKAIKAILSSPTSVIAGTKTLTTFSILVLIKGSPA